MQTHHKDITIKRFVDLHDELNSQGLVTESARIPNESTSNDKVKNKQMNEQTNKKR
jgi:hypothetical protein